MHVAILLESQDDDYNHCTNIKLSLHKDVILPPSMGTNREDVNN